jgi:hypothetical protein
MSVATSGVCRSNNNSAYRVAQRTTARLLDSREFTLPAPAANQAAEQKLQSHQL